VKLIVSGKKNSHMGPGKRSLQQGKKPETEEFHGLKEDHVKKDRQKIPGETQGHKDTKIRGIQLEEGREKGGPFWSLGIYQYFCGL